MDLRGVTDIGLRYIHDFTACVLYLRFDEYEAYEKHENI